MTILAIDTANEFGSLALCRDGEPLEEVGLHAPQGFSGILFEQIEGLLLRQRLRISNIDAYAAASGPGSFTGVRVGLAAMKAMAEVNVKPCFGISNLAAMANFGTEATRAAVVDARRGEVYGGVFGFDAQPETVGPITEWLQSLPDSTGELLAFDFTALNTHIQISRLREAKRTVVSRTVAASIAHLAVQRSRAGEHGDPLVIDANYVRRSDAELLWKDRAR